jgi:hypothetical protein
MTRRPEPQPLDGGCEEDCMLKAIPTTTLANELFLDAIEVKPRRSAEENVEVLECNSRHMRTDKS